MKFTQVIEFTTTRIDEFNARVTSDAGWPLRALGDDLTGMTIVADAPVTVFTGHAGASLPIGALAEDHLEEQLLPEDVWTALRAYSDRCCSFGPASAAI